MEVFDFMQYIVVLKNSNLKCWFNVKSDSHLPKKFALLLPFKKDEKCFLFDLKRSFRSLDI